MSFLGAKVIYTALGAGTAATGYYFVQDGVWNRAEVAARGIAKMQEDVPSMKSITKIDRPEVFTSVSSAFQGEFTARLWNDFASAWNYGVLSVREGVDQAMGGSKK